MHPHMGILYYPWQYFASISPPYWENFANTVSGNFHVAFWGLPVTLKYYPDIPLHIPEGSTQRGYSMLRRAVIGEN
jgi:hypothetical protein